MAFSALGINKLRSFLTMSGITIGVFSVIGVMTAVSALRGSIETGLSFLGSNIFQFAKMPTGLTVDGNDRHKYEIRRNIKYAEAQRYIELMSPYSNSICLKAFENNNPVQATFGGRKTTPGVTFGGTDEFFLTTNQFTIETGRNFTAADVDLIRPVAIIGQDIVTKLYPSENPLGKIVKANGRTYTVIGTFASKGSMFGQSEDEIIMVPSHPVPHGLRGPELLDQHRDPGAVAAAVQRHDGPRHRRHAHRARPPPGPGGRLRALFERLARSPPSRRSPTS